MIETRLTRMLGIRHPIISSGLMRVSTAQLVAPVANAGALGFLTALSFSSPEGLAREIERTREMTDNPFGVNLTILPTRKPVPYPEYVAAIIESGITLVETAGSSPEPFMPYFDTAGVKVMHKCTSVRHALKAQRLGCVAVEIDGFEAAGHPGEDDIPSLVLVPRAVDALEIPVIACGGFSDERGLVAALAMGAEGISMGTRFMATVEAPVHEKLKQELVKSSELDTQLILRKFRNTARIHKNSVAKKVAEIENREGTDFSDIADLVSGEKGFHVLESGDMEYGIWWSGISQALIDDIPTVDQLVSRMVSRAETIIRDRLTGLLN